MMITLIKTTVTKRDSKLKTPIFVKSYHAMDPKKHVYLF